MLFNSLVFLFLFLPVTYLVFWRLPSTWLRHGWLTVTGYVFYAYWDPRFCLLMAFSTLVSFLAGLGLLACRGAGLRKVLLIVPIAVDLAVLAFFKYANFLLANLGATAQAFGWSGVPPRFDIILPVGISFYTFHTITYIVDCYRGVIRPTRSFLEFASYVSLFSQLVAGPIVRFRQIEPDLESLGDAQRTRWLSLGLSFFVFGLVEKVLVADTLAAFVDPAWRDYAHLSTTGAWLAVLGYTFQLYFDFSGYSSMAVGLGYLFGLRIPQNFASPYQATDPSDFWQRWHISLSSCLRDYLYIPLGGSRGGRWNTLRNLMVTMFIGGLWHGANWTFVAWGLYHGLLLILYNQLAPWWNPLPRVVRQLLTFFLVAMGWVFFRAADWTVALAILTAMFTPVAGQALPHVEVFLPILALAALWAMAGKNAFAWHQSFVWSPRVACALAAVFGGGVAVIMGEHNAPFLYFQF